MNYFAKNIPMKYRPVPFWSWNDKLDPAELRRQIREMYKAGLGGFFMHARGGLQTEYLSQEWLDCICVCLDEAGKIGMSAWLYDENGWPSGFGGGLVNQLGVDYQQKYLRKEFIDASLCENCINTVAFYSADGSKCYGKELPTGQSGKILHLYYEINPYYVDNMDKKVVAEFLKVTHQFYYEHLPQELLKNLHGIFTDEPQLSRNGIPWSFILENEYHKAYTKELIPELPMLFLNTESSGTMRIRFWKLCARLFTESYMKQIHDWCDAHNWRLIGHQALEEACQYQLTCNGSVMTQYRYYHIPGVDHLGRELPFPVASHQVVSSAMQFGQKQILTESFAMTGWACNFSGMRWIYTQQMARGINFLCPHLQGYSLRGMRKRDYPPSNFDHQPWWDDYKVFNDSVSRIGMMLAEGKHNTDILIIHPISSAWKVYTGEEMPPLIKRYSDSLDKLTRTLDSLIADHHYADEYIVDEAGSVDGNKFIVGECSYHTVILPQISNISGKTAELLQEFSGNGGLILLVRNQNQDGTFTIDGEPASAEFIDWLESLPSFESETAAAQKAVQNLPNRVLLTENGVAATGVAGTNRDIEINGQKGRMFYFANTEFDHPAKLTVSLPALGGQVEEMDIANGKLCRIKNAVMSDGYLTFEYIIPAGGDACFFVTSSRESEIAKLKNIGKTIKNLDNQYQIQSYSGNLLTLDHCRYQIDNEKWNECDIIDLQNRLLRLKKDCNLKMEIDFFCDEDFDFEKPLQLIIETPELFRLELNGTPFEEKNEGFLFDRSFRKITLPQVLHAGCNTLVLKTVFNQEPSVYAAIEAAKKFEAEFNKLTVGMELESVYLYGDFSVRHTGNIEYLERNAIRCNGKFSLGSPLTKKSVNGKNLELNGLPFFSGKIKLSQDFELTNNEYEQIRFLSLTLNGANSCKVVINGINLGSCFYEPVCYDVKSALHAGKNQITLELVTSLRNTLGPHHLDEGECIFPTPQYFYREENIIGGTPLPSCDGFCFVETGICNVKLSE